MVPGTAAALMTGGTASRKADRKNAAHALQARHARRQTTATDDGMQKQHFWY